MNAQHRRRLPAGGFGVGLVLAVLVGGMPGASAQPRAGTLGMPALGPGASISGWLALQPELKGVGYVVAGLPPIADWTAESDQYDGTLGVSVGTAGDVNGDGYDDVIVGAHRYDHSKTDEGAAFVYHGSADGLSLAPAWMVTSGQGYSYFGRSVGTAGDVNGDGYSDVIVGASKVDSGETDEGMAFVYYGSAGGLSATPGWTAEGDQDFAGFGFSVGTAGDVNGDGYDDVIVGAYGYDSGETNEGVAFVYYGSAGGLSATPDWIAEGDQASARFGRAVGTAGDVNGDGYDDVIVGANRYDGGQTDEGAAFIYYGSAAGPSGAPDWTVEGDQNEARLGNAVGTAGDVNGDGYDDVAVGAHSYDHGQVDEGRAYVYYGSMAGPSDIPDWTAEGDQNGATFGISVGTAGDVDGDGYADLIVGAPWFQHTQVDDAWAAVYYGSELGLSPIPGWTVRKGQDMSYFGFSVGTAGDVNGDGVADAMVGAHLYDHPETDEGQASVYHGLPHPIAGLIATNDSPTELGASTTLTATITSGTLVTYTWAFGDETSDRGAEVTHVYPDVGLYTATVTASNSVSQLTATTVVTITDSPIQGLTATSDSPTPLGSVTTLTATVVAGSNVTYTWALGDETFGTGAVVTHAYPAVGLYTATVTASNSVTQLTATTPVTIAGPMFYIYLPYAFRGDW